jgi:hypothetical protein
MSKEAHQANGYGCPATLRTRGQKVCPGLIVFFVIFAFLKSWAQQLRFVAQYGPCETRYAKWVQ